MAVEITWLGHASFRIRDENNVVYLDPWKVDSEPHDADVVFVSHDHFDHCSPPDIEKVSNEQTALIAPADTIVKLHARHAATPGETNWFKDVQIESVAAYNVGKNFHPKSNHWCGAVFTIGGKRIYYAGDTDLIPEMGDLRDVDVALLPVGGTYTLDAAQAAAACERIGCATAIPYHWGDIVGSREDADAFAEKSCCDARVLQPGHKTVIE